MSDTVHVFVSSTWLDLQPERKAAESALQRMRETKLVGMEYFGSSDSTTRSVSLAEVDRSHFYIGIFGGRYGSGITEDEYRRAKERGIPCRIYFKADSTITDDLREADTAKADKLKTLKAELRRAHTVKEFTNPDNLAWRVTADLHDWLVESRRATRADLIPVDISRILKYAPAELIGRDDELKLLDDTWLKARQAEAQRPHVLTFVALGGEGKTSLVAKWAASLAHDNWPGCDAVFAWSFYSQGTRDQVAASSDLFLKEALTYFALDDKDRELAPSNAGAFEKGQRLARLVGQRCSLLILDGLEPLQYAPTSPTPGELKDQGLAALLKGLAQNSHGLCIVTTRYSLPDLRAFKDKTVVEKELKRLSTEAGVALLQQLGVRKESGSKAEFEKLVEDVKGHALTLTLLGGFLKRAFHGDIRKRDRVNFEKADEKIDGGHAFRTMAAYEQWLLRDGGDEGQREVAVLRLMGLFDRPADAGCLAALLQPPAIPNLTEPLMGLAEEDWNFSLESLASANLITVSAETVCVPTSAFPLPTSLDAHPHLREYFAKRLKDEGTSMKAGDPPSSFILPTSSFCLAHRRLYEHLCATTPDKPEPTLDDLQPLYQAVAHGCQAGLQQKALGEVLRTRIWQGTASSGFYSTTKLGAVGSDLAAIACFFEIPWRQVCPAFPEVIQASLIGVAAVRLRALGRLTESIEPMRSGVEGAVRLEDWENAAIRASNLSELELTLGAVAGAVEDAAQSVTYADRSRDAFVRMAFRTTHADALHQAGRRAEAETRFREAEQMQKERQPTYPLLYSLRGFQYCDLLLAEAERAAWRRQGEATLLSPLADVRRGTDPQAARASSNGKLQTSAASQEEGDATGVSLLLESCRAVSARGEKMFEWRVPGDPLLDIALDHLTLGRAALYAAILDSPNSDLRTAISELAAAVSGLRRAGQQDYLPRGLLSRAWLRFLTGARTGPESAQEDLDEAWEIAERGPMKLFMADIHLTRFRLLGMTKEKYPWESPEADLKAARELIEKCGYGRRKPELEDAEAAWKRQAEGG